MAVPTKVVRIGLVLYIEGNDVDNLIAVIESVRKQSQVPYYVRLVIGTLDNDVRFDPRVEQAVYELKQFCPNVVTMLGSRDKADGLVLANNSLSDKDYDVLVIMNDDVVLPIDTLFHMTGPYLWVPKLLSVDAIVYDARYKPSLLRKLVAKAMSRSLIQGYFRVDKIGVLSASRKITAKSNLGEIRVPFWHEVHKHGTAEEKLTLFF